MRVRSMRESSTSSPMAIPSLSNTSLGRSKAAVSPTAVIRSRDIVIPLLGVIVREPYEKARDFSHSVLSLDSEYEYERAINENTHGTLLMHKTQSASGESHGVHHQLLSEPAMHTLRSTRLRRSSRPAWGRPRHSSAAVHPGGGDIFGSSRLCVRRG